MHRSDAAGREARFAHGHRFLGEDHAKNARRTTAVVAVTAVAMVVEIAAGFPFGSMALLADGFHMATHAGAIGIAALAYRVAARRAADPRLGMGAGDHRVCKGATSFDYPHSDSCANFRAAREGATIRRGKPR